MLIIKKQGHIKGGEIEWSYDVKKEELHYYGSITLKVGPISKKVKFNEVTHVDKENMYSKNVVVGKKIDLDNGGHLEVVENDGSVAKVVFNSDDYIGDATLSVTEEIIDILTINAEVDMSGFKFKVVAEKK